MLLESYFVDTMSTTLGLMDLKTITNTRIIEHQNPLGIKTYERKTLNAITLKTFQWKEYDCIVYETPQDISRTT